MLDSSRKGKQLKRGRQAYCESIERTTRYLKRLNGSSGHPRAKGNAYNKVLIPIPKEDSSRFRKKLPQILDSIV